MSDRVITLPDVGEGLTEAEILTWHVAVGDEVAVNQAIVEIETAKAAVELPCAYAGVVVAIHVAEGDVVEVGAPILTIGDDVAARPQGDPSPTLVPAVPEARAEQKIPVPEPVLVGYGVRSSRTPQRRQRRSAVSPHGTLEPEAGPPGVAVKPVRHGGLEVARHAEEVLSKRSPVLAKPPVRRLAKDLGVDLRSVQPTGDGGVVTRADVQAAATDPGTPLVVPIPPAPAEDERIPVRGVLRAMADAMVRSAFTAPHVTEWVEVDVTRTVRLVERLRRAPELAEIRVSPLLLVAAGLVRAVRRHPRINATWDGAAGEVVVFGNVNLGVATATSRGLLVPNIKGAQELSLVELAMALDSLVATARAGTTAPSDLTGGTITLTNVGVFGIDGGTPILNPGEGAILAAGRIALRPWVHKGRVRPRHVMQLSLSFDHRFIDGELGSRFLADVGAFLADPGLALSLA